MLCVGWSSPLASDLSVARPCGTLPRIRRFRRTVPGTCRVARTWGRNTEAAAYGSVDQSGDAKDPTNSRDGPGRSGGDSNCTEASADQLDQVLGSTLLSQGVAVVDFDAPSCDFSVEEVERGAHRHSRLAAFQVFLVGGPAG